MTLWDSQLFQHPVKFDGELQPPKLYTPINHQPSSQHPFHPHHLQSDNNAGAFSCTIHECQQEMPLG